MLNLWLKAQMGQQTAESYSEGLAYTLSSDGTAYAVSGIGTCTDTDIRIPPEHNGLPVIHIGKNAFQGNSTITSVIIPYGVILIGTDAFQDCSALENVNISDSVRNIENRAFHQCRNLTGTISMLGLTHLYPYAFQQCDLSNIIIGENVTNIDTFSIIYNANLSTFTIYSTTPPTLGSDIFAGSTSNLTIYVPASSVEAYKTASGWSSYASIIQAIPN